jgi:hypothetical protein
MTKLSSKASLIGESPTILSFQVTNSLALFREWVKMSPNSKLATVLGWAPSVTRVVSAQPALQMP